MSDQNKDLLELRTKIVGQIQELALSGAGSPDARLRVLMEAGNSGNKDPRIYDAIYDITSKLPNDEEKMNSMLDLLYEVDQAIAPGTQEPETPNTEG